MDECVKRDDVYEFAKDQLLKETGAYSKGLNAGLKIMMAAARNKDAIASADVRPVVYGKWLRITEYEGEGKRKKEISHHFICSVCKETATAGTNYFDNETPFCPWCGADMREGSVSHGGEYADNPTLAPA